MYTKTIISEARNPKHFRKLPDADLFGEATNPVCGDEMSVYVKKDASGERIERMTFSGRGCMIMMATSSRLLDALQGKPIEKLQKLSEDDAIKAFGEALPPGRINCALLPLEAIKRASGPASRR